MPAHSENSIKIHAAQCKGKLCLQVVTKKNLKADFELWTCSLKGECGSVTKPGESPYVGRGKRLSPEEAKETRAALKAAVATAKAGEGKMAELAKAKADKAAQAPEELSESDAPVAELNEAKASKGAGKKK